MSALIGKYFIGVHDECMRSGIIEAAVNEHDHPVIYLVRFDELIGFTDGSKWPEALALVPISNMMGNGGDDGPPPWWFFDNAEQRAKYDAWLSEPEPEDPTGKPRVVSIRRH